MTDFCPISWQTRLKSGTFFNWGLLVFQLKPVVSSPFGMSLSIWRESWPVEFGPYTINFQFSLSIPSCHVLNTKTTVECHYYLERGLGEWILEIPAVYFEVGKQVYSSVLSLPQTREESEENWENWNSLRGRGREVSRSWKLSSWADFRIFWRGQGASSRSLPPTLFPDVYLRLGLDCFLHFRFWGFCFLVSWLPSVGEWLDVTRLKE